MNKISQDMNAHGGLANNASSGCVLANLDLSVDHEGWTVIPFGSWPHSRGLQIFGKAEAENIVSAFKSTWSKLKRAVTGLPVYKGHPDVPEFADEFPDRTEYGQVADMEVRPDGLAIKQVLSQAGAELVKSGWKFISPFWDAKPAGTQSGVTRWFPTKIFSIGLVKKPNIPNKSLANQEPDLMNKADLIKLFGLAAEATDEQVTAAVTTAAGIANSLANAQTELTTEKAKVTELEGKLANSTKEVETAATALANERTERVAALVVDAVKTGRITAADSELWKTRLGTSFATESVALANIKPTVKTSATTEQELLAALHKKLAAMSAEERLKLANGGTFANGDVNSITGIEGDIDTMANVKAIANLVASEMESPACKGIKSHMDRHQKAFQNVMAAHPRLFKDTLPTDGDE